MINFFGYFNGDLGYNVHTRELYNAYRGLYGAKSVAPVAFDDFQEPGAPRPDVRDRSFCIAYGNEFVKFAGGLRFGCTVWETDKVPAEFLPQIEYVKAVCVSEHNRNALVKEGFDRADVAIVPEGVSDEFSPFAPGRRDPDKFRFLAIGKLEKRKGYDLLFRAFAEEFKDVKDVELCVQCYDPFSGLPQNVWPLYLNAWLRDNEIPKFPLRALPMVSRKELPAIYTSCDAFALPTRGEAWGLPILEAMACGLPTIATEWGGQCDFFDGVSGYPVAIERVEPAADGRWFRGDCGNWAVPNYDALRRQLRYVYEHREEAEKVGLRTSEHVHSRFSWTEAAKKLHAVMGEPEVR